MSVTDQIRYTLTGIHQRVIRYTLTEIHQRVVARKGVITICTPKKIL